MSSYNMCRLCRKAEWETPKERLFQYAVRHWCHTSCGIERWGAAGFLAKLHPHVVTQLPALILDRYPGALSLAEEITAKHVAQHSSSEGVA